MFEILIGRYHLRIHERCCKLQFYFQLALAFPRGTMTTTQRVGHHNLSSSKESPATSSYFINLLFYCFHVILGIFPHHGRSQSYFQNTIKKTGKKQKKTKQGRKEKERGEVIRFYSILYSLIEAKTINESDYI